MSAFIIQQGTDSGVSWPVTTKDGQPISFVGWSGVAQLRSVVTNKLLHTFSTQNGNMVLNESKVTLLWTNAETSAWKWDEAKIGIELTNPQGKIIRFKQELVSLSKEVVT